LIASAIAAGGCGPSRPAAAPTDRAATAPDAAPVALAPPDAAPLPLDHDLPALAARWVDLYAAIADALAGAGGDCARAIERVGELRARFADVRDATDRVRADGRVGQLEVEIDRRREPIEAALARMRPTLDACANDARLDEALEELVAGEERG
jgi:hypothetical protein